MKRTFHLQGVDDFHPKDLFAEESTLFVSVLKWSILASITGVVVGSATSLFLYLLKVFIGGGDFLTRGHAYFLLPVIMPLVVFIIRKLAPAAEGHGTEKVIEAVHTRDGAIDTKVVPVKLFATLLTLGAGGSVGKEGPAAQIGGGLAYWFARIIRLNRLDAKRLVICGISAGFAAVFGTPISGAIFGAEVLYLGLLQYNVMFPCLVAGVVAHLFCQTVYHIPSRLITAENFTKSHAESVLWALLAGLFFGFLALLLIEALNFGESIKEKLNLNPEQTGLFGGILLIGIFLISPQSSGLGTDLLAASLSGGHVPVFTAWWKIIATSVTLGFGGSGGVVNPIFVIGSSAGAALAPYLGIPPVLLAAFGMVALLSAGAGTPIAASVMALELFGPEIGTYAALACCTAYIVVGHRSVYPSQILGASKSMSIEILEPNARVDDSTEIGFHTRSNTGLYWFGKLAKALKRHHKKEHLPPPPQPSDSDGKDGS